SARWPVPKLFLELVCDPTGLVATLLGNAREHGVPFGWIEHADFGLAVLDKPEIAVEVCDVLGGPFRHEAASRTWLTTNGQRAALGAFDQLALASALPLLMLGRRGAQIWIKGPVHTVLWQAVTEYSAGMIEDDDIGLAFGWPQTASDHLAIESHLLRGTSKD